MSERPNARLVEAAIAFGIRAASAGLVFALQVLLARLMALEAYGGFVTLWTWMIALGSFVALGLPEASIRFLPRYRLRGRDDAVRRFWWFGLAAVALTSSALAAAALVPVLVLGSGSETATMILLVALSLPFLGIEYYLDGVARSFGWFRLALVPVYIVRPMLIGAACLTLFMAGVTLTLEIVGAVVVIAMAAVSCGLALVVGARLGRPKTAPGASRRSRLPEQRLWIRASLPLLLVSGLEDLLTYCDVLVLGLLMAPQDVAIYFAAARTLALVNFAYFAIYVLSGRDFALAFADPDRARRQQAILEVARLTFWLTLAALAVTLAAGPYLLSVFGAEFRSGYSVMAILAAGLLARAMAGQAGEFLIVAGRQRDLILLGAAALGGNVVLAFALVPRLGIEGAALATSLAMAGRAAGLVFLVHRRTGLRAASLALPRFGAT